MHALQTIRPKQKCKRRVTCAIELSERQPLTSTMKAADLSAQIACKAACLSLTNPPKSQSKRSSHVTVTDTHLLKDRCNLTCFIDQKEDSQPLVLTRSIALCFREEAELLEDEILQALCGYLRDLHA